MKSLETQKINRNIFIYGIPLSMVFISIFIINSNIFKTNPDLMSFGVTFDLIFSITFIYYLLIRKTKISNKSISIVLTLNLILATFIIPKPNQIYLNLFKNWFLPLIEIAITGIIIYSVKKKLKEVKENKVVNSDFFSTLKQVSYTIVPKYMATPLSTEIAVFYYGFINWKKAKLKENEFSYYKNSGIITTLIGFMMCAMIECFVVHLLLMKWSEIVAWIITGLCIYTLIQIYGILRAFAKRPITIEKNGISLKYSIISEGFVEFVNIKNIEIYTKEIEKKGNIKHFSPFGKLEGHNIKIELINEQTIESFYGKKKKIKIFTLFVDNKNEFINQVETKKLKYKI
jgi:hypothetical protein